MGMKRLERTWSGLYPDQVRSALQKSIRRGELDDALWFGSELVLSGGGWYLWLTLVLICSEDAGPAWIDGPA